MKFLGAPYPITKNPKGFLYTQEGLNQVQSDLLVLFMTNPGERVMLPDYGTPLRRLLFDPNDETVQEQAREMIIQSIRLWEPRVVIQQIDINTDQEESLNVNDDLSQIEHILFIRVLFYSQENINEIQELKLQLPIGGQ